ncbi:N-acetyltransferase [Eubacteriales bacterium OttesenSCG-928-A19]|nr:N-acetyltransferase [Eubacteriales bacterium OttesenSCG-928-A19]
MQYTVVKEQNRHYIPGEADAIAEMLLSVSDRALIIESTYVDDVYRGQGLGLVLLESVVERARQENKRIVPLCPYAKAQLDKHPEYADVVQQ